MTALTGPRLVDERNPRTRRRAVKGGVAVFLGGMAAQNGVLAVPASANAALKVLGVAAGTADNRLGADGAMSVDITIGVFSMVNDPADPLTAADVNSPCYASDDQTVSKTNANGTKPQAGIVVDIDDNGGVWVRFS